MKVWPLFIASSLGLFVTGCQKPKPVQKVAVRQVRLDRDLIETSAIRNDWRSIRKHIMEVNGNALSPQNQSYAFYWLGVSQHKWEISPVPNAVGRALERRPDMRLTKMIQRAFQQSDIVKSYQQAPPKPSYSQGSSSQWVLQLGILA